MLRAHQTNGLQARMTAGFCWPWSEPVLDDDKNFVHLVDDVNLPQWDWKRPWNVQGGRSVGGYPSKNLWATDPAGFTQVGCIYTAQGFEYDCSGVIFGPDLVWRDGVWVADRKSSKDTVVARAPEHEFAQPDPQYLQSASHPRHAGNRAVLHRHRNPGDAPVPGAACVSGTVTKWWPAEPGVGGPPRSARRRLRGHAPP
jgi:hypothetical protein